MRNKPLLLNATACKNIKNFTDIILSEKKNLVKASVLYDSTYRKFTVKLLNVGRK